MSKFFKVRKLFLLIFTGMFLSMVTCLNVFAADSQVKYFDFKSAQFAAPAKTGFISWTNQYVISVHTPHHNGYDEVYKVGQAQSIEGKFQYGDFRKDLEGEWVSIYEYSLDNSSASWTKMGRMLTDSDGRIKYNIPDSQKLSPGLHLIKLYVEGDGTEADMYIQVLDSSKKYVVFDMDGTLTTSDFESVGQYASEFFNADYVAKMYPNANDVSKYYASKGYGILYLSARPYWLTEESQNWLIQENFPMGLVHVNDGSDLLLGEDAAVFKTNYLNELKNQGIQFSYGYGNASTDVEAYSSIGIDKKNIFTIGPDAGVNGSTPISSYTDHLKQLQ